MSFSADGCEFSVNESAIHYNQKKKKKFAILYMRGQGNSKRKKNCFKKWDFNNRTTVLKKRNLNTHIIHEIFIEMSHRIKCKS